MFCLEDKKKHKYLLWLLRISDKFFDVLFDDTFWRRTKLQLYLPLACATSSSGPTCFMHLISSKPSQPSRAISSTKKRVPGAIIRMSGSLITSCVSRVGLAKHPKNYEKMSLNYLEDRCILDILHTTFQQSSFSDETYSIQLKGT